MFPKYRYHRTSLTAHPDLQMDADYLERIVEAVFESWSNHLEKVLSRNQQKELRAELYSRREGRSGTPVLELSYLEQGVRVSRFIVRLHLGSDSAVTATRERDVVQHIQSASQATDYFSGDLIRLENFPEAVIYRHAADQFGEPCLPLNEKIDLILKSGDERDAHSLGEEVARLLQAVTGAYGSLRANRLTTPADQFQTMENRLFPDIIINASERFNKIDGARLTISTADGDQPSQDRFISDLSDEALAIVLERGEELASGWLKLRVQRTTDGDRPPYFSFRFGSLRIWLCLSPADAPESLRELVLKLDPQLVNSVVSAMEGLNIPRDSFLAPDEYKKLWGFLNEAIQVGPRHTDLHLQNILCAASHMRLKVVDLASVDDDLLMVGPARLETSLIFEVSALLRSDAEEADALVSWIDNPSETHEIALSSEVRRLASILQSIRRSITSTSDEMALAYAAQVMFHCRYALERNIKPGHLFVAFARHWLLRFQEILFGSNRPGGEGYLNGPSVEQVLQPAPDNTAADSPMLISLWELALRSQIIGLPQERGRRFLEGLYRGKPDLLNSPLTSIQRRLWEAPASPFQSDLNVVISAPTASGKSTVAEMFLVAPAILNNDRRCSIYIAPTRALTQAKHRELLERFSSLPSLKDSIVLSTGEDDDHDWRIRHGNFSVACMVYEKANILFSTNSNLLDVLACLVVDEFHMLSNLERGPILEIALTKVLAERRRIDALSNRGPRREALRVVAITTEENPAQSVRDLLSVRDTITGEQHPPLVFFDSERPVKVEHCLVLRGSEGHGSSTVFPFLEFSSSERRTLPVEEIVRIDSALAELRESPADAEVPHGSADKELKTRLDTFLADLLTTYQRGYRVLVFVPSRRDAEEGASRLKNTMKRRVNADPLQQAAARYKHEEILKRLRLHLDGAEDTRMADLLRRCAARGIFIHHSDVDKKVRLEIENICSRLDPDAAAQVIFATETLSYGVNLAISDVIIVGTHFITQTRFRVRSVAPLSTCEFHNMVGRTGRLGRTGRGKSRAYIFVPSGADPTSVITDYYTTIDGAESRLYVKDDRAVQLRAEENPFLVFPDEDAPPDECGAYRTLGVLDFSYPFVRSVLDALRHLNASASERGDTKTPIRFDLLLELLGSTLYSFQFLKGGMRREPKLFKCAVRRILDDCSREDLHLVESSKGEAGAEKFYRITARGEAIIDTGTEVHTVEPLLRIVSSIQDIWSKQGLPGAFTPDLQVLCILAQNEVFRQVIFYTPECRPYRYWPQSLVDENRQVVITKLENTLLKVVDGLLDADAHGLAVAIRELLDRWEPLRKVNAGYPGGATDSLLRLYCGIASWINLEERATVDSVIEGHDLREGFQGRLQGFRQFTDLLSWKTLFLAKILVTDKAPRIPFGADDERSLHLLASRLRLGCTAQAIPLFWPFSSDFRRPEAAKLLSAGATPRRILAIGDLSVLTEDSGDIVFGKLERLRQDLERYAKSEFNELAAELIAARDPDDVKREAVNKLWEEMRDIFAESIISFRMSHMREQTSVGIDDILRTALNFEGLGLTKEGRVKPYLSAVGRGAKDERYRIRIEVPSSGWGLVLHGEQEVEHEEERPAGSRRGIQRQRQHSVWLLGVQFRSDWQCSLQKGQWIDFKKLLVEAETVSHLMVLASPWIPLPEEMSKEVGHLLMRRSRDLGCTTSFISPAGLLLLLSSVIRGFIGSQACMRLLTQATNTVGNPYASLCVSDVLQTIDSATDRQVPPSIREKMLRHFEV